MKHIAIPNIKIMCLQAITIDKSDVDFTVFSCSIFIYVNHLSNRYDNLRHTLTLWVNFKWTYIKENFWWTMFTFSWNTSCLFPESIRWGSSLFLPHASSNTQFFIFSSFSSYMHPPKSARVISAALRHPRWSRPSWLKKHNVFIKFLLFARAQKAKNWQQYHRTAVVTKSSRASSGHPDWKNTMFLANSCFSRELTKVKNYNSTTQYHTFASSRPSGIT